MATDRMLTARSHWRHLQQVCNDDRSLVRQLQIDAIARGAAKAAVERAAAPLLRRIDHRERSLRRLVFSYGYGHRDSPPVHVPAGWDEIQDLEHALNALVEASHA